MQDVLLINASYQVLTRIDWQRAITLCVTGDAEVFEAHPNKLVRSQYLSIPMPTIIRMLAYVHVPFQGQHGESRVTRASILLRDRRCCAYCGGRGDTIDHVIPQSRGGQDTWDNLVACCGPCNNRKGDRTPLEASMKLLWLPRPVRPDEKDQRRVWDVLSEAG